MKNVRLAMCTLAHLITDLATVAYLYTLIAPDVTSGGGLFGSAAVAALVLAYDSLAFGLQPLFGVWIDRKNCAGPLLFGSLAAIALCNVVAAFGLTRALAGAVCGLVIVSVGNAVFHVSAGAFVIAEGKNCAPLGVFVGAGALGVAFGKLFSHGILWIGLLCLLCAIGLYFSKINKNTIATYYEKIQSAGFEADVDLVPLALLCAGVLLRGFCGTAAVPSFAQSDYTLLCIALGAAAGKTAGGFLADRFGIVRTVSLCVPAGAILCCFGSGVWYLYAFGVALFNISMPLTLFMAIRALPRRRNTAFGILAALLMAGSLPAMLLGGDFGKYIALTMAFVSVVAIVAADRTGKNKNCFGGKREWENC